MNDITVLGCAMGFGRSYVKSCTYRRQRSYWNYIHYTTLNCTILHSTPLHNATQHSTPQHNRTQHNTMLCRSLLRYCSFASKNSSALAPPPLLTPLVLL